MAYTTTNTHIQIHVTSPSRSALIALNLSRENAGFLAPLVPAEAGVRALAVPELGGVVRWPREGFEMIFFILRWFSSSSLDDGKGLEPESTDSHRV